MTTSDLEPPIAGAAEAARLRVEEVERLTLLVEASGTLLGSLRLDDVLSKVLGLARRMLAADAYALWRFHPSEQQWAIESVDGLSEEYQHSASAAIVGNSTTVSLEGPIVAEDVDSTEWLTSAHREAYRAEGIHSMMAIPLRRLDQVLGTLAFYYRQPHRFTASERSAATTLANLASSAIATAELYEAQTRTAEDRAFLAEATAQAAAPLDVETTLVNVAALAVPRFADWCTIDMVGSEGQVDRLAPPHSDPGKVRLAQTLRDRYPPDPDAPYGAPHVIRTGEPELTPDVPDELLVEASRGDPELLRIFRGLGFRSVICVPLVAREQVLGAITFVAAESDRRYGAAELATAQDLARRAAVAVDNALLYRDMEAARSQAQESLSLLDSIYDSAPVGLAFMDRELRYVRLNEALAAMNGGSVAEHLGRTLSEVLGEVGERIEPLHRQVLETGEPVVGLVVAGVLPAAPDDLRTWLASYYPVRDTQGEGTGGGVVVTDGTEPQPIPPDAGAAPGR